MSHNFVDLSGQKFGYLTVIKRIENKISKAGYSRVQYECLCDCGTFVDVVAPQLRNNRKKSCGTCGLTSLKRDFTGLVFDELTVLHEDGFYEYPNGDRDYKWRCLCACGNQVTLRGNSLRAKGNHNCGCYRKRKRVHDSDMIGYTFGKLLVESRADDIISSTGSAVNCWNCICSCGRSVVVRGSSLRNGHTSSCGCYRLDMLRSNDSYNSKSEDIVIDYLISKNLKYVNEKTYADLVGLGYGLLAYDFYIQLNKNKHMLVECHGLHHYEPVPFFGGDAAFDRQIHHDNMKLEYADKNNIPLLVINCVNPNKSKIWSELDDFIDTIL